MPKNPQTAAGTWNHLYDEAPVEYRKRIKARIADVFQGGKFAGQESFRNHEEEAADMEPKLERLILITQMPFDIKTEPIKQRAQQMLRRYEEITNG